MRAYSQSAGYAEQALAGIRVVHTYCQEQLEVKNYVKYLQRAKDLSSKINFKESLAGSMIGFVIFNFYAYVFYWCGYLKYHSIINSKTG